MPTLGPNNFDKDGAYDVLGNVLEGVIEDIRRTFTFDSEESLYDDLGEAHIMANIDILLTLCEHYHAHPVVRHLDEVTQWKEDYLKTFDRTVDEYDPSPDYVEKRRAVIVETFDRLYQLVKQVNKGRK